jgi:glycosyltransferase involved in cell wall biosynthesis
VDQVEFLIIGDRSSDRTIEVARELGVNHIVINKKNMGLARSFRNGLDAWLKAGAGIIVNTDGDNQYLGADGHSQAACPIFSGQADIVICDRETSKTPHFSRAKEALRWFGSGIVRKMAGIWVPDAVSGFRLFKSIPKFVQQSVSTMVRMYAMHQPLKMFFYIGTILSVIGFIPIIRFGFFYFTEGGAGHIQSLVLGGVFMLMGFIAYLIAMLTDLISFNRQLLEMTLERVRRLEFDTEQRPPKIEKGG